MLRVAALCAVAACAPMAAFAQIAPVELFDGTLTGWSVENTTQGNIAAEGGTLGVRAPEGWLKSERQYADFELVVEFRFLGEQADSGIFVRAQPQTTFGRGWPSHSYQLQLLNPLWEDAPFPPVGWVYRHRMPDGETQFDAQDARRAFTGTGEWQTVVLRVVGDELTASLNGMPLTRAANIANAAGYIGLQAETGAVEYRRIAIREL